MPRPKSGNSDALWAEAFRRALTKKTKEPQGPGWLTIREFSVKTGIGRQMATRFMREELKLGRMERFIGSQLGKDGNPAAQYWYKPTA